MKKTAKFDPDKGADWGFPTPTEGKHRVVVEEGIDTLPKEDKNDSYMIPVRIQGGDSNNIPFKVFVTLNGSGFTKMKLESIIACSGLGKKFDKQFDDKTEADDPKVLNQLQLDLPGRELDLTVEIQTYVSKKTGNEQTSVNVVKIEKPKGQKDAGAGKKVDDDVPDFKEPEADTTEETKEEGGW